MADNPLIDKWSYARWKGIAAPQMTATEIMERQRLSGEKLDQKLREMQKQLWEKATMSGIQKKKEGEEKQEIPSADLGYEIPDTSGLTKRLDDARINSLQREHQAEAEEDEKDEKQGGDRKKKRPKKQVSEICCCHNPGCRIGPFEEIEREVE